LTFAEVYNIELCNGSATTLLTKDDTVAVIIWLLITHHYAGPHSTAISIFPFYDLFEVYPTIQ